MCIAAIGAPFAASADPPKKAVICHNGNTISVSFASVAAHEAHGDTFGSCLE